MNLLASRFGRLTAFFFLYLTEGIPLGFLATAIAARLRRDGATPAEIGAFIGTLYLPWTLKWALGPVVEVFSSPKLGRRRMWIVLAQSVMVITLLSTVGLELPAQLKLFTYILLAHNIFAAAQDVAIDGLAVNVLEDRERGLANGVMFGAAMIGQMIGGAGVLHLSGFLAEVLQPITPMPVPGGLSFGDRLSFQATFFFVCACIASVTLFVSLRIREPKDPPPTEDRTGGRLKLLVKDLCEFPRTSFLSLLGSRPAFVGMFFALIPTGAMSLGLALQSNLAVELGLSDKGIANLQLASGATSATFCVLGGILSDRFGRLRTIAVYSALTVVPGLLLASQLSEHGWVMPVDMDAEGRVVPATLQTWFIACCLVFACFNGLMYGTRCALFMDVTNPAVAGTQFTVYMALLNLAIAYTATWQGIAIDTWGYPTTLVADGVLGLACLLLIPWLRKPKGGAMDSSARIARRSSWLAVALATLLGAQVVFEATPTFLEIARPILNLFFNLAIVASGVFLATSAALFGSAQRVSACICGILSPALLLVFACRLESLAKYPVLAQGYSYSALILGGAWLLVLAFSGRMPRAIDQRR